MERDAYFAYEKRENGICILRCYASSGSIVIPEVMDGAAVTEVSAYAFADEMEDEPLNSGDTMHLRRQAGRIVSATDD